MTIFMKVHFFVEKGSCYYSHNIKFSFDLKYLQWEKFIFFVIFWFYKLESVSCGRYHFFEWVECDEFQFFHPLEMENFAIFMQIWCWSANLSIRSFNSSFTTFIVIIWTSRIKRRKIIKVHFNINQNKGLLK